MLGIERIGDLAAALKLSPGCLYRLAEHVDDYVAEFDLLDSEKSKVRTVISPQGLLRHVQTGLHRQVFRGRMFHSRHSYGGVPGRNARMNAARHIGSRFIYTTDLADFFPSIEWWRVDHIFARDLRCSAAVARLLAKLCTHKGRLAQGLLTSPLIADYAVRRADARIAGLCRQHEMQFTRFVDDVSVSGRFALDLDRSGLVALIRRILAESEFAIATHKEKSGPIDGYGIAITGLQVSKNKLDVQAGYVERLMTHLTRHNNYGRGGELLGPLFTRGQLAGRIEYVCSINGKWKRHLRPRLGSIDWPTVMTRAELERLVICRKQLVPKSGHTCQPVRPSAFTFGDDQHRAGS